MLIGTLFRVMALLTAERAFQVVRAMNFAGLPTRSTTLIIFVSAFARARSTFHIIPGPFFPRHLLLALRILRLDLRQVGAGEQGFDKPALEECDDLAAKDQETIAMY